MDNQRRANRDRLETIVQRYAPAHGWPIEQARQYLTNILHYEVGPPQLEAIAHFAGLAHRHGLIDPPRELDVVSLASAGA
jgi:predicted solute-binding protein